ncbi:MAG: alcohol dehydrogenase catalytic domain-containing protein [Candidatus Omnitrophica bacterium]|nr:alcohol dehydrogenase catalytic domain-containing protein [Candidatus Omnitrophota bacterium]
MKAAIFYGIENIKTEEKEKPKCGEKEVLVKVAFCAICGTDVRIFFSGHKKVIPPAVIGHEITGEVSEIGKGLSDIDLKIGDKIVLVTSIGCGKCPLCKKGFYNLCPDTKAIGYFYSGGYAEYVTIPEPAVQQKAWVKLPSNVSLLEGALIEPLSCVINGQNYLDIEKGDTVVIYGGGPIGLMHAVIARAKEAENIIIIDPNFQRLESFAKKFEGLILLDPKKENIKEKIKSITSGFGAEVVITAAPAKEAQMEALEIIAQKGRISFFGGLPKDNSNITIDSNKIHYNEISVFGSFASNRVSFVQSAELISQRKIAPEKFITEVIPLEDIEKGIRKVRAGEALKIVVKIS